jgi:hypothetical protein
MFLNDGISIIRGSGYPTWEIGFCGHLKNANKNLKFVDIFGNTKKIYGFFLGFVFFFFLNATKL